MTLADYLNLLAARQSSMTAVVEMLPSDPVIVETGCLRQEANWIGDGQSTRIWNELVAEIGAKAFSVDNDPGAVALARRLAPHVKVELADSVKFLAQFAGDIDLLYLDSRDFGTNSAEQFAAALHCLFELCAAAHSSPRLVMVDDTIEINGHFFGKGAMVADYLKKVGAQLVVADRQQVAWKLI
jgi:hypothetical protein